MEKIIEKKFSLVTNEKNIIKIKSNTKNTFSSVIESEINTTNKLYDISDNNYIY